MELELCIESLAGIEAAKKYGIKRVELCTALDLGGLTPSYGLIQRCSAHKEVEVHVMIRPRPGDFIYTIPEKQLMLMDIMAAGSAGAKGVVFGLLNEVGGVDVPAAQELTDFSKKMGLEVTFHRAFDTVADPRTSLEDLINIGCTRILTSGGERRAIDGIATIGQLVMWSAGRIQVMAGAGIDSSNAPELSASGVSALHFSAREPFLTDSPLPFGTKYIVDEKKIMGILSVIA